MIKKFNPSLLIITFALFCIGFITLLSTSKDLVKTQLIFFVLGLVAYFIFSQIDYSIYKYIWKYIFGVAVLLLIVTFAFAELRFGSARWIEIGSLNLQPSEFAKLALIIAVASLLSDEKINVNSPKTLGLMIALLMPILGLVLVQPDLGTGIVIAGTFVGMLFIAGLSIFYFLTAFLGFGIFSAPIWSILHDYQKQRILVFLNPELDVLGSGYNVIQSMIAIGSGGLLGKGFGRGTQASLEFLPAHWTDFIFAAFAEEWGLLGVITLIILFIVLLSTILYIAHRNEDRFARLLCIGIFFIFFIQFLVNVGMNMGIMPVTGVTLPLVSYGGSSMLLSMICIGIIQNIWQSR